MVNPIFTDPTNVLARLTGITKMVPSQFGDRSGEISAARTEAIGQNKRWIKAYFKVTGVEAFAFVDLSGGNVYIVDTENFEEEIDAGRFGTRGLTQNRPQIGYFPDGALRDHYERAIKKIILE